MIRLGLWILGKNFSEVKFFRSEKFSSHHTKGYIFLVDVSDVSLTNFLIAPFSLSLLEVSQNSILHSKGIKLLFERRSIRDFVNVY